MHINFQRELLLVCVNWLGSVGFHVNIALKQKIVFVLPGGVKNYL